MNGSLNFLPQGVLYGGQHVVIIGCYFTNNNIFLLVGFNFFFFFYNLCLVANCDSFGIDNGTGLSSWY